MYMYGANFQHFIPMKYHWDPSPRNANIRNTRFSLVAAHRTLWLQTTPHFLANNSIINAFIKALLACQT